MHINAKQIQEIVLDAVAEFNRQMAESERIPVAPETRLLGKESTVDSLGLVGLIVLVEQKIGEAFDVPVTLVNEDAMSRGKSPFRSIQTLIDHVASRLVAARLSDGGDET